MEQWTIANWKAKMEAEEVAALYFYTPMCGTCEVASKMLNILKISIPSLQIGKMDINYVQELAIDYKIESVPCLIIAKNGEITDKVYAFESVTKLYELLKNN